MFSSSAMHWDFALILFFLAVAVPILGRRRIRLLMQGPDTTRMERLSLYASTISFQWLAAGLILWRCSVHRVLPAQLGLALPRPALTLIVFVALSALILANQLVSLRRLAAQPELAQGFVPQLARKIFPRDTIERLAFFPLVLTVALCEEFVYRGFAQHVFQSWSRDSLIVGILASAAMFSLAHLYQGPKGLASTFVIGLVFSVVRAWTGSLFAPFGAHFVADITVGFLAPRRLGVTKSSQLTESKQFD
ncbi:MAG: CPBP family intramembrane glutamic endopeptidase [Candidatus Acidiferrales bacterium]